MRAENDKVIMEKEQHYLLQVDVVQVIGAADSLHHPAIWCDHIEGEKGRFWELHEAGSWTCRYCVIGHEGHVRLQDVAVKAVKTKSVSINTVEKRIKRSNKVDILAEHLTRST